MTWLICRTKFGSFDDPADKFLENETGEWVPLERATRFNSRKFLLPRGHGAVFITEKDAKRLVDGKIRLEVTSKK